MKLLRKEIARIRRHLKLQTQSSDDVDATASGKHSQPAKCLMELCCGCSFVWLGGVVVRASELPGSLGQLSLPSLLIGSYCSS